MPEGQAAGPAKENPPAAGTPAKDATALTGLESATSASSSLTSGATPELPHAWMAGLTTEQKANADLVKSLSKFEKGIPDISQAYVELEKKAGQSISIPGEQATPEEMTRFRKAAGVPEKPEDYKLEKVKLPTGELDGQWDKELRTLAHKLNLSQGQLGGLHEWYFKNLVAEMQLVKTTAEQATQALRKEMGAEYEAAITYKTRAVDKFLNPTTKVLFEKSGLGNHPEILKMFVAIGKGMGEHFFAEGSRGERLETATFGKRTEQQLAGILYPTPVK